MVTQIVNSAAKNCIWLKEIRKLDIICNATIWQIEIIFYNRVLSNAVLDAEYEFGLISLLKYFIWVVHWSF